MTGTRRVRAWLSARRRFQFCLTTAMVVLLTGLYGTLLLMPNSVLPTLRATLPPTVAGLGQAASADDPRLTAVRRTIEPFGAIVARRIPTGAGRESLVVGHPGQRVDMDVLERELPAATAAVSEVWGPDWTQSAVIVVAAAPAEFAALVRAGTELPTEIAAVSIADPFVPGTHPIGQRVVFSPDAGQRLGPAGLTALLRHELTHVATRALTVDGAPQWMLEGFADYTAHRREGHPFAEIAPTLAARVRAGLTPGDLPPDAEFGGRNTVVAYEQAWSVCAFIADKYDEPRLVDLYRRIAAGRQDSATEDRVLREVLGTQRTDLVADWQVWLAAKTD